MLVVSTSRYAVAGSVRLFLMEGDQLVKYDDEVMAVRANQVTVAFATLDFADFPHGANGELHVQLFNAAGDAVSDPLVEPFKVVTQPILAGTPQLA